MLFLPKITNRLFVAFAVFSIAAAIFHFLSVFYKFDASPPWRHLLFFLVNIFCIYGFLQRPWYFVYFIAVLLLQQYYSHGTYMINLWIDKGQIHWISVFDLLLLPIALLCLIDDHKIKRGKL